jgi:hypothetical protein
LEAASTTVCAADVRRDGDEVLAAGRIVVAS